MRALVISGGGSKGAFAGGVAQYLIEEKKTFEQKKSKTELQGIPVSDGAAIASFIKYRPPVPRISTEQAEDPNHEWEQLENAVNIVS